jgi:hypothetical protein
MTTTTTTITNTIPQHLGMLILETDGRSFVPGDDVWVTVRLKNPTENLNTSNGNGNNNNNNNNNNGIVNKMGVRGSVALVGEERTQLPGGWAGSCSVFDPIQVFLESSKVGEWRVKLKLPNDIPPSCELSAVPPSGIILYVVTARLQENLQDKTFMTASQRIKVVRGSVLTQPNITVEGIVLPPPPWWFSISKFILPCCTSYSDSQDSYLAGGTAPPPIENLNLIPPTAPHPVISITLINGSAFKPGEHVKFKLKIRGENPNGGSRILSRVDGFRLWIRRSRWVSDGQGHEMTVYEVAKPPQIVDLSEGASGILPIEYNGSLTIPLGIAPTVRGSNLTNEFDLVIEIIKNRYKQGIVEVPITTYSDVEGAVNVFGPSPHIKPYRFNSDVLKGDGIEGSEADDPDELQELALA